MSAALDFDTGSYRAQLNPDFARRVRQQRKAAAARLAAVEASEKKAAFERAVAEEFAIVAAELAVKRDAILAEDQARRAILEAARRRAMEERATQAAQFAERARTTYHTIEYRACRLFGLRRSELHAKTRKNEVVFAKHFVMYWARRLTALSMPQIGKLMGGVDHTTVMNAKRAYVHRRAKMGRALRAVR